MFSVQVRDHVMVAHSLAGEAFGPAQGLHGATFVVDAAFLAETLNADNVVVDIGKATEALKAVLAPLAYRNLDEVLPGAITTTEFLCRHIFQGLAAAIKAGTLGAAGNLTGLEVTLHESHVARASYRAALS